MAGPGVGGLAATNELVIVSDRELDNTSDSFKALHADSGDEVWSFIHPAPGNLDFGSSPRATPLIHGDQVFLFGAFGHLHCLELATGNLVWQLDVRAEFDANVELPWGTCASPLIVDGKLVINPGAPEASLVGLDPSNGQVVWKSAGAAPSYGSFLSGQFGGRLQLVGHDVDSLGGWDPATGKRLWRLQPPRKSHEFNVPTPVRVGEKLLVATEHNGTRLYQFRTDGTIDPQPLAVNEDLAPDSHTPIVVGNRVFGIWSGMHCLALDDGLRAIWTSDDSAFARYASLIASADRILATTLDGELLLVDTSAHEFRLLGRQSLFSDDHGVYSHPALVGHRLFVRGSTEIVCVELE